MEDRTLARVDPEAAKTRRPLLTLAPAEQAKEMKAVALTIRKFLRDRVRSAGKSQSTRLALAEGTPDVARAHVKSAETLVGTCGCHRREADVADLAEELEAQARCRLCIDDVHVFPAAPSKGRSVTFL